MGKQKLEIKKNEISILSIAMDALYEWLFFTIKTPELNSFMQLTQNDLKICKRSTS